MPSIESFQKRLDNPKVYYIFYDYFFKAVMGEKRWKRDLEQNNRLGTSVAEAFAHALIKNNYFAWLFEYKSASNNTTLKTVYDGKSRTDYGDLCDEVLEGVEITLPSDEEDGNPDYQVLQEATAMQDVFNHYKEQRSDLTDETIEAARANKNHMETFKLHLQQLELYELENTTTRQEGRKKKCKCMRGLKVYTAAAGSPPSKSSRKSPTNKGCWSGKANKFMCDMTKSIKSDVESGKHRKWEKVYRDLIAVKNKQTEQGSDESAEYEVDCGDIYEL